MECWFCQRVNVLQSNSSDRKGKAKAAIFPLEGTKDNFKCKFCGNRNLRDRVSPGNAMLSVHLMRYMWYFAGGKLKLKLAGDVQSRFQFSFLDGQYVIVFLTICRSLTHDPVFQTLRRARPQLAV
jgi:hypothetical protein